LGETVFLKQEGHKQLVDLALTGIEFQHTAVATTRSIVARNRRALVNYARTIVDAIRQMKNRKEESIKIMAKYLRLGDRQAVEMQYDENVNKLYLKKPYPTFTGIKTILDSVARNDKAKSAKPEDFADMSIVRELDESGFIDNLYR
jgi:NitT/TauT family transport system substrate-binding protein